METGRAWRRHARTALECSRRILRAVDRTRPSVSTSKETASSRVARTHRPFPTRTLQDRRIEARLERPTAVRRRRTRARTAERGLRTRTRPLGSANEYAPRRHALGKRSAVIISPTPRASFFVAVARGLPPPGRTRHRRNEAMQRKGRRHSDVLSRQHARSLQSRHTYADRERTEGGVLACERPRCRTHAREGRHTRRSLRRAYEVQNFGGGRTSFASTTDHSTPSASEAPRVVSAERRRCSRSERSDRQCLQPEREGSRREHRRGQHHSP